MARAFDIKDYAYDPEDYAMNLVLTNRINESRHPEQFRNLIAEFCNTCDSLGLALIELVVNKTPLTSMFQAQARESYDNYLKKIEERSSSMKAADRFKKGGFYVLGVTPKSSYVAEMAYENNVLTFKTPLTVVTEDELQSRPEIAVPMTFAKVYFETHKGSNRLYSLPMVDEYIDDLDICIGYQNSTTTWALIPKVSDTV